MWTSNEFSSNNRPALLIISEDPTRHIIFLWGIEKLSFSYAKRTALDGHIVAFSRDIVAGDTPTTIAISDDWWGLENCPVPSQQTSDSEVTNMRPEEHSILKAAAVAERS